jgi:carbon monoxide dehydrogenase subunit G
MADREFEHSAESKAPPASVWERYTDVEQWCDWSPGVEESSLEGEFEAGSKGTVKPPQLPRSRFELVEVEPEQSFVSETKLPGGTLSLEHVLEPSNGGSRITHRATFTGPLGSVWMRVVGWIVKRDLPSSVERLAEVAVEKEEDARKLAEEQKERKERLKGADERLKAEIEKTSSGEGDRGGASLPGA